MWFQSYLSNRSFRVNVKSKYSITAKFDCEVPQGSILYVNDMKKAVGFDLFHYTDDSYLVYQQKDVNKTEQSLSIYFGED